MDFLSNQIDFLVFTQGYLHLAVSVVILLWGVRAKKNLSWRGIFGYFVLVGLSQWLQVVSMDLGFHSGMVDITRLIFQTAGFLCLLEFGRRSSSKLGVNVPPIIYAPIMVLGVLGVCVGITEYENAIRYSMLIPGGLLTAYVLYKDTLVEDKRRSSLAWILAGSLLGYVIFFGMLVPQSRFFPSEFINSSMFDAVVKLPIDYFRTVIILVFAVALWVRLAPFILHRGKVDKYLPFVFYGLSICFLVPCLISMNIRANNADKKLRSNLLDTVYDLSQTIDLDLVKKLKISPDDLNNPYFSHIEDQLKLYGKFGGYKSIYTMFMRGDKILFGPENIPLGSPQSSPPGTVYLEPQSEDIKSFKDGNRYTIGPAKDEYGTFVSAIVPVTDPKTNQVAFVLGMDFEAQLWQKVILSNRLVPLIATGLLFLIMLFGFYKIMSYDSGSSRRSRRSRRSRISMEAMFIFVIGTLISLLLTVLVFEDNVRKDEAIFKGTSRQQLSNIRRFFLNLDDYLLPTLRNYFEQNPQLSKKDFKTFSQTFIQDYSIASCGLIKRVLHEERAGVEQELKEFGGPGAGIFILDEGRNKVPQAENKEYYVLYYVEPGDEMKSVVGYDVFSLPESREAILQSIQLDDPIATGPLVRLNSDEIAETAYVPVHFPDRDYEVNGVAFITIRPQVILKAMDRDIRNKGDLKVELFQLNKNNHPILVASNHQGRATGAQINNVHLQDLGLVHYAPIMFCGKTYILRIATAKKEVLNVLFSAVGGVLLVGMFITALIALLVNYWLNRSSDLEEEVRQRTLQLKQSEEGYRSQFSENSAIMLLIDPIDGYIVDANKSAVEFYRYPREELLQKRITDLNAMPKNEIKKLMISVIEGVQKHFLFKHRLADGREKDMEAYSSAIVMNGRHVLHSILHDVTERMQIERELILSKDVAEKAAKVKSQFLANMSHEIRTPMNAILGFSDILASTPLSEQQTQYIKTIRSAGELLLSIINDILDFSKLESGKLQLEMLDFDLENLVYDVFRIVQVRFKDQKIDVYVDYDPDAPRWVRSDPTRIRQILMNLLGNAAKFTTEGEVGLIVKMSGAAKLRISVKDTGIGIEPDVLSSLFKPFTQADESTTRKFGGTGLGLAICRQLSEMMGGKIWVESEQGKGSEFILEIPYDPGKGPSEIGINPVSMEGLKGKTVICVDDHQTSLMILERICQKAGLKVLFMAQGVKEALEKLDRLGEVPDILLTDIMMPDQDGYMFVQKLHGDPRYAKIKTIAITSDVRLGTAKEARTKGFDGYLPKPFSWQEIVKVIAAVLGDERPKDAPIVTRHLADEVSLKGMRVLIVEDSMPNQQLMKVYMDMFGCSVDFAENGQVGIDKLKEVKNYDVILMDLQMPVMGGDEAARIIRKEISSSIPIIALTAAALKEDQERCMKAGMNDFLTKPINIKVLKEKLIALRQNS